MIVSSSTGAVLDTLFMGLPTAVILDEKSVNLSPAKNLGGVVFVRNANDLSEYLINMKFYEFSSTKVDDYFFLNPRLNMWKTLLV